MVDMLERQYDNLDWKYKQNVIRFISRMVRKQQVERGRELVHHFKSIAINKQTH